MLKRTPKPSLPLGAAIRAERRRRGLTQTATAALLGISYRQLVRYERGDARTPGESLAAALRIKLGIEPEGAPAPEIGPRNAERQAAEIRRLTRDVAALREIVESLVTPSK